MPLDGGWFNLCCLSVTKTKRPVDKQTMKTILLLTGMILASAATAPATIIVQSYWQMGEEVGDTDGRIDSVGGRNFSVSSVPVEFTGDVAPSPNGSGIAPDEPTIHR